MPAIAANSDYVEGSSIDELLKGCDPVDWGKAMATVEVDKSVKEVTWLKPGATGAKENLNSFCSDRLRDYGAKRNDPNILACSSMSPYFNFGQISVQRTILHVKGLRTHHDSTASFVEESVVRRELSDNFCYYNKYYDSLDGCYDWAKTSLKLHWNDKREHLYSQQQLEKAQTHDDLWNAAQIQLTSTGKMHGFLRMYWAKKVLEWTENPNEALRIALYLNDRYALDGNDPNGYVGCMWSIGGIHDQGWAEREIFGKIRYMNYAGCKRKFDIKSFVAKYPPAAANAKIAADSSKKGQTTVSSFFKKEA
jgi:deoxyribodipyrimidine photo-lyase